MPETILVTGGAGFIGSELIRQLLNNTGSTVVNVDKLTYAGNLESLKSVSTSTRYRFEQVDICCKDVLTRVFAEHRPDVVVHLAAESHVDRSIDSAGEFIRTNIVGTHNLLDVATGYWRGLEQPMQSRFRFHHVSTDEVFGSCEPDKFFSESSPYNPSSPYAASKAGADHIVRAWHKTYGLPILITNCSNNYGPYQYPEKLIPLMILSALAEKPLPVYGDGGNMRDWLYVEDHCRALQLVLQHGHPGITYNIGGGSVRSNLDVVRAICDYLDRMKPRSSRNSYSKLIACVKDRPGHDLRYAMNTSKIARELGWAPHETFESGLEKTVTWYLDNQAWCRRVQDGNYRGERLGLRA